MNNIDLTDIEQIVEYLRKCDDEYFNSGATSLTDREYDSLKRTAFSLDPSHEYFVQVGSDTRGGKIKLPYTMGSLNQVYEGEVQDWVSKYSLQGKNVVVSHKLDGVSCMLVYNNGKLSIAYSRGNGVEGADITRHIKNIPSVPKTIPSAEYLVVRAEVIMDNDTFNKNHSRDYKNPRNMVAGAMNRKETEDDVLTDLTVIAYEIVAGNVGGCNISKMLKSESLSLLNKLGFVVADHHTVDASDLSDVYLSDAFAEARGLSQYELDGLVVTVDDHANMPRLSASSTLNPEHSVKYKVLDSKSVVETFVTNVLWEISKSGFIKPRVEIFPVELFGTTVKYATGFNAKYIIDNGIGKGAKVKITKSGMVIPYIVEVVKKVQPQLPPEELGEWRLNQNGVEAELVDKDAEPVVFKQVLDFFETYKIDQLKEANLLQVWNHLSSKDYDDAICEICDLSLFEWNKIIGANGTRIYESIQKRMHGSSPETFFGACRYMGVGFGVRKAKALLAGMNDVYNEVKNLSIESIVEKEGFDYKTASMVLAGIPKTLELMDRLTSMQSLTFVVERKTQELQNVNVVMTGFRDAELHATIESMGGKVGSGVSKKTTHLLCLDPESNSSKMQKARELGIAIMTPDQFKYECGL